MNSERDFTGWTVLIVEDEPDNVRIPQMTLEHYGAEVCTASDGIQGLKVLEDLSPTLILLDLSMPHMDGWKMFELFLERYSGSETKVIAMTAHAMEHDRQRVKDAGFHGYISKPFLFDTFFEEINRVVSGTPEAAQD